MLSHTKALIKKSNDILDLLAQKIPETRASAELYSGSQSSPDARACIGGFMTHVWMNALKRHRQDLQTVETHIRTIQSHIETFKKAGQNERIDELNKAFIDLKKKHNKTVLLIKEIEVIMEEAHRSAEEFEKKRDSGVKSSYFNESSLINFSLFKKPKYIIPVLIAGAAVSAAVAYSCSTK
jgi:hypothetical protein